MIDALTKSEKYPMFQAFEAFFLKGIAWIFHSIFVRVFDWNIR